MSDAALLRRLAESIADGVAIDWAELEPLAADRDARQLLEQGRIVAGIAELHRTVGIEDAEAASRRVVSLEEGRLRRARGERLVAPATPAIDDVGASELAARTWGPLEVLDRIGEGATSEVYRARDPKLDRHVALKLLNGDAARNEALAEKVLAEGRAMARVSHRNVVSVHGADRHDGRVGLWMELIEGRTLDAWLASNGPLSAGETAVIGRELCSALAAVHAAGLIHRDIKAQNVIREARGRLVLMDFGTGQALEASALRPTRLTGTPLYLAGEVLFGEAATVRTDLYSLGVLLFHLLTGRYPVTAASLDGLKEAHRQARRVRLRDLRPDVPPALVEVIERAIDPDPARRYASAGEMDRALADALQLVSAMPAPDVASPPAGGIAEARHDVDARSTAGAVVAPWWRARFWLAAAAAAVAVLAVIAWYAWRPGTTTPAVPAISSIAVLPLATSNPEQQYFADGMTEALIGELAALQDVRVISRTSVMRFRGTTQSLAEVAKALGVDGIVEGSADRDGDRVRVSVRLLHAGTETPLLARVFERNLTDVLRLQGEVAVAIGNQIRAKLRLGDRSGQAAAVDPQAFDAYLRGRFLLERESRPAVTESVEYFRSALASDANFAPAYAGLARAYLTLVSPYRDLDPQANVKPARDAVGRALLLDDRLSEAHMVDADLHFRFDWDFEAARRAYDRARQLAPHDAAVLERHANFLSARGRLDEALHVIGEAAQIDPLSPAVKARHGILLHYARRLDEARAVFQDLARTDPSYLAARVGLERTLIAQGQFDAALTELQAAAQLTGRPAALISEEGQALAGAGRTEEALARIAELEKQMRDKQLFGGSELIAYIEAQLGRTDEALGHLEHAIAERAAGVHWMLVDPRLDGLRGDPRFAALLARLGLASQ